MKQYDQIKYAFNTGAIVSFKEDCLRKILIHSYKQVPYYSTVFNKIGIITGNEVDLAKFNDIPILTKEMIRKNRQEMIAKDNSKRRCYYISSGGTTGEPVTLIKDEHGDLWSNAAAQYYYKDIIGIDELSAKKIFIWGSERDIFYGTLGLKANILNWLNKSIFLNSFKMTMEDMAKYIQIINIYKPALIRGYAGSLFEIARYAKKNAIKIYHPEVIISAAEPLTKEIRDIVESIFGAKVYNFYGSREAGGLAGECRDGFLHTFPFNNYVEVLDNDNQPVGEGKRGRVIVTNIHNYSMPLIRYEIGDIAEVGPERCACGNGLPTLKDITGRSIDYFVREDGALVYGDYFTHLFYLKAWLRKFQVIQEDYKKITISVVLEDKLDENEKIEINEKIKLVMGQDCNITWKFVKEISRPESGKHIYTKTLIKR